MNVPLMRLKEIRDMDYDQRLDKIDEFQTELLRLKTMVKAGGTVENPARIKALHRTIARILTVEQEEKLGIRASKEEPKEKPKKKKEKVKAEEEEPQKAEKKKEKAKKEKSPKP